VQEFGGNVDKDLERVHYLNSPFIARYVRFHPLSWHRHISMRAAVIGCQFTGDTSSQPCHLQQSLHLVSSHHISMRAAVIGCQFTGHTSSQPCHLQQSLHLVSSHHISMRAGVIGCQFTGHTSSQPSSCHLQQSLHRLMLTFWT